MSPRKFIDFFKTKTGNFLLFAILVGIGGGVIYGINVTKKSSQPPIASNPGSGGGSPRARASVDAQCGRRLAGVPRGGWPSSGDGRSSLPPVRAGGAVAEAEAHVGDFLRAAGVVIQPIQPETAHVALEAFARYGKGRGHPARLNLGDCFIYAQTKVGGASLLYKGEDFSKTDIESAS